MPLTVPTWIIAIATVGLFVGAIITAVFAILAFRQQSRQLEDQQRVNKKLLKVLKLQAKDLITTAAVRGREAREQRRAQASEVFITRERLDRDPALNQVAAGLTGQQHTPVVVMTIENTSNRPVYAVELRWEMAGIPAGVSDQWETLAAHGKESCTRPIPPGDESLFTAVLWFTDADNTPWERLPGGEPAGRLPAGRDATVPRAGS